MSTIRLNDRKDFECNDNISNIENIFNNEKLLNETIITLKLTKKHYKTAYVLAHMLGHKSLDDYVSYIVVREIEKEIKQGEIDLDIAKLF